MANRLEHVQRAKGIDLEIVAGIDDGSGNRHLASQVKHHIDRRIELVGNTTPGSEPEIAQGAA